MQIALSITCDSAQGERRSAHPALCVSVFGKYASGPALDGGSSRSSCKGHGGRVEAGNTVCLQVHTGQGRGQGHGGGGHAGISQVRTGGSECVYCQASALARTTLYSLCKSASASIQQRRAG